MLAAEQVPILINAESDYEVFSSNNKHRISSDTKSLIVGSKDLLQPETWMYSQYSSENIRAYRFLHLIGVFSVVICFLLCEGLAKFQRGYFKNTPFCVDPIFNSILWGFEVCLECIFLYIVFQQTPLAITLIADKLRNIYFTVYFSISLFFISTNLLNGIIANVITDICACLIFAVMLRSYLVIKYEDDGRYIVSWSEYLGVHIHFSVLLAWSLMMICEYFFRTLDQVEDKHEKDSTLLGIEHQTWTVLVMVLNLMVATFWLYKYKDIYFAIVLAFTFFGIFSMEKRVTCHENSQNCSDIVKVSSVSLGSILLFFALLTFISYPRLVLYNLRKV